MDKPLQDQLQEIEYFLNEGDIDTAQSLLEELSKEYPNNYQVTSLLGECYLSIGQPDKAIKPLKWAMKKHEELLTELKEAEAELDEIDQNPEDILVRRLKKSAAQTSENPNWIDYFLLGCAYSKCNQFQPAIKNLNVAKAMNPENAEVIRNIGWIRCLQQKQNTGRKLLRKAISMDPENALAYNDLGASYLFEQNFDEAEKWIKKAKKLDPEDEMIISTAEKLEELKALKTIFKTSPQKNV